MNAWPIATVELSAHLTAYAMEAGLQGKPLPKLKCIFLPGQLLHINTVYENARRLSGKPNKPIAGSTAN